MNTINLNNNLIGRFYFKRSQNGNLMGEFSNNNSTENSTESADLIGSANGFIGEYRTTWREGNKAVFSKLVISYRANSANKIFQLEWFDKAGQKVYIGEGFTVDELLVGDYRDFNI